MRANYHTHCQFCDGKDTAEQVSLMAKARGYDILGFSSHEHTRFTVGNSVAPEALPAYAQEIRRLQKAWAPGGQFAQQYGPLEILLGIEKEWLDPEYRTDTGHLDFLQLDYSIGSVHFIKLGEGDFFAVDLGADEFANTIAQRKIEHRAIYREYYRQLTAMIEAGGIDIVGHFDLIKKNNGLGIYFAEDDPDYLASAYEACHALKKKNIVVEINLGGIVRSKTKTAYPNLAILKELKKNDVPVTICSDAHAGSHLGLLLDEGKALAEAAGYKSIAIFSKGAWQEVDIKNIK